MKIIEVTPFQEFQLFLRFEDGSAGVVDLSSYAGRGVFVAWLQPGLFAEVNITEAGALEWPGEIDLCPDALYQQLNGKLPENLFPNKQGVLAHA